MNPNRNHGPTHGPIDVGSFPLTVTVTTMGYRSYKNPLNKAPLRTVTGRGNDAIYMAVFKAFHGPTSSKENTTSIEEEPKPQHPNQGPYLDPQKYAK